MCWISFIYWKDKEKNIQRIKKSLDIIQYRWDFVFEIKDFWNWVFLWSNRLAIQSNSETKNPISNENGQIRCVQNWEVFNYEILKQDIIDAWHILETESDTELLVHMYEIYWNSMISKIDSEMFAIIIYDQKEDKYFIARDRLWVKPLYYWYHNDWTIHFASELKQLSQFEDIQKIYNFPKWYIFNWKDFVEYDSDFLKSSIIEEASIQKVEELLVNGVIKRINTNLPIGVFLSWWVDSSLIMEIATKNHQNVTAIILWKEDSNDYQFALKLCNEKWYQYKIISPLDDYYTKIDEIIYHTESFEPNPIRHSFANNYCSELAKQLWFKIILVWEWADELFWWYNEFLEIKKENIKNATQELLIDMEYSQLKRVDRNAMHYTIEVRCPFLDTELVNYVYSHKEALIWIHDKTLFTKYILRQIAQKYLPEYISWRDKEPFANWAWMNVWYKFKSWDWEISDFLKQRTTHISKEEEMKYNLFTIEEKYYFNKYKEYWYNKLEWSEKRCLTKDTLIEKYG